MIALLVVATLAGCTDTTADEPGADADPAPEPVGEFRAEADQLCQALAVDSEEARRDQGALDTPAARIAHIGELVTTRSEFAENVAGLDPEGLRGPDAAGGATEGPVAGEGAGRDAAQDLASAAQRLAAVSLEAQELASTDPDSKRLEAAIRTDRRAQASMVDAAQQLGLEECALQLDPVALDEIGDALTEALTSEDPSERCEWIGSRLLGAEYGDEPGCAEAFNSDEPAAAVQVLGMRGVADVYAEGRIQIESGLGEGTRQVRLTFERGRYRIDHLD